MRTLHSLRAFLRTVLGDRRGVAAVFLAVALVPLVGAVGLAVDSSLGYLLKTRMGKSLDTAGLAAGRVALDEDAEDVAREFFDANFGDSNGSVTVTDFDFELDPSYRYVTLTATATTPTHFMRVFGRDTLVVSARSVIERETSGMELALVMDNTGSMWDSDTKTSINGTPFKAMRDAALSLVGIIYGSETEVDNLWVSLVPFVATVNVGPGRTGWLAAGDRVLDDPTDFRPDLAGGGWKGCVMARAYPHDTDDSTPAAHPFTSFFYPDAEDNDWPSINDSYKGTNQARKGPNLGCGTPITPLTKARADVEAGINAMRPWRRGGTAGNLGLAWGWRTISPGWRGLWGDAAMPLDYDTPLMEKVVVILTDGNNEFYDLPGTGSTRSDFTSYGRVNDPGPVGLDKWNTGAGVAVLDSRMSAICDAMKAKHIRIYTIIFGDSPTEDTKDLYQACATTPAMYYYAPNNAELATAFRAIGGQLANLRIIE